MSKKINLTTEEETKSRIIRLAFENKVTNGEAAVQLNLTVRQVQRLKQKMRNEGFNAVVHGLRGKIGNHQIEHSVKEKALSLIKEKYRDFKPGFATEKLGELHQISVSSQTIRLWMSEANLWKPRTQKKTSRHRNWRPRKEYYGQMQQFDGSYHVWLEDRYKDSDGNSIELCLLASIDDATGKITKAWFAANEGVLPVFNFWKTYVIFNGKPVIIYLDRFSTYKINHKTATDNKELMTQFERACQDLDIELINAHSPQAKGRIERLFETLQDRLVKEMRLAGINNPDEANIFLQKIFIKKFNEKFAVTPTKDGDVHRKLTKQDTQNLNRIFSVQTKRTINQDFTIQFKTKWYQLKEIQPITVRPKEQVAVEERLDGVIHFNLRGHDLSYCALPERPQKMKTNPIILTTHKLNYTPPTHHPWKKYYPNS